MPEKLGLASLRKLKQLHDATWKIGWDPLQDRPTRHDKEPIPDGWAQALDRYTRRRSVALSCYQEMFTFIQSASRIVRQHLDPCCHIGIGQGPAAALPTRLLMQMGSIKSTGSRLHDCGAFSSVGSGRKRIETTSFRRHFCGSWPRPRVQPEQTRAPICMASCAIFWQTGFEHGQGLSDPAKSRSEAEWNR